VGSLRKKMKEYGICVKQKIEKPRNMAEILFIDIKTVDWKGTRVTVGAEISFSGIKASLELFA